MEETETINDCGVAVGMDGIVFLFPVPRNLERERALRLAAYIVALADEDGAFDRILKAVQNT